MRTVLAVIGVVAIVIGCALFLLAKVLASCEDPDKARRR